MYGTQATAGTAGPIISPVPALRFYSVFDSAPPSLVDFIELCSLTRRDLCAEGWNENRAWRDSK